MREHPTRVRAGWSEDALPAAMLLVAYGALACTISPQSDTFYHLRSGREMLQTGGLLTREVFSHTAYGLPLPNHWWLSQLAFIGLYEAGGAVLLTVVTGGCALVAVVLSWRMTSGSTELRLLLLALLMLTFPQWSVRPQVFSLLMLIVVVRLVLADRLGLALAGLVLWANLHAVVVLGVLVVWVAALESIVWSRHRRGAHVAAALAASAAPVMTPLGVRFWPWLRETVDHSRRLGLQEYMSPLQLGAASIPFLIVLGWVAVAIARDCRSLGRKSRSDRVLLLCTAILGAAALVSQRNVAFFALLAAPALSRSVPSGETRAPRPAKAPAYAMLGLAALGAIGFVAYRWRDGGAHLGWKPFTPAALTAIRRCPAPLFNGFADGGALMWFVPEHRVFMDGRIDVYPLSLLLAGRRADLDGAYDQLFDAFGIRCAVVRGDSPMRRALAKDRSMAARFADDRWAVFERR